MSRFLLRIPWFRGHTQEGIPVDKSCKVTPEDEPQVNVAVFIHDDTVDMGDDYCVICHEEWKYGDMCYSTHCNHVYHSDCLMKWMERSKSCPTCRAPVIPPNDPK